MEFVIFPLGS
jgi:IQ and AAA domain-containing protein